MLLAIQRFLCFKGYLYKKVVYLKVSHPRGKVRSTVARRGQPTTCIPLAQGVCVCVCCEVVHDNALQVLVLPATAGVTVQGGQL